MHDNYIFLYIVIVVLVADMTVYQKNSKSLKVFMEVSEACKVIELADEFVFEESTFECIPKVQLNTAEETEMLLKALYMSFWGLPKQEHQNKWVECIIRRIEEREDSEVLFKHLIDLLKKTWNTIGLRRTSKFVYLLKKIVRHMVKTGYKMPLKEYLVKGPSAIFEQTVLTELIKPRKEISEKEVDLLLNHLSNKAPAYFVQYFAKTIIPVLRRVKISKEMSNKAYALGNTPGLTSAHRNVFYTISACYKEIAETKEVSDLENQSVNQQEAK
ncbi:hypothetical protein NEOKW01_1290 [Nematocida sp. AWRm80]|nr:hypothetical protein NEOKW01_1290 [Nematocida sp. AWRm80]